MSQQVIIINCQLLIMNYELCIMHNQIMRCLTITIKSSFDDSGNENFVL